MDSEDNVCEQFEIEWRNQRIDNTTNLQAKLECPVCREVANPPIFVCSGGHTICGDCRPSLHKCPKCSSSISKKRCPFAEKVMSQLSLKCKFEDDGCKVLVSAIEFKRHILKCPNRPIECFIAKCSQLVPFRKFYTHLTTMHGDKVNGVENSNTHNVEWWIEGDPTKTARWPPYYLTCFDNVFLYNAISTVHGSWEWAWIIGSEEEAKRFRVRAVVENLDKVVNLQWTGAVHSIRKSIQEIVASGLVFVTNTKELQNPYIYHKNDAQKRSFWHTDVEIIQIAAPPRGYVPYINTEDDGMVSLDGSGYKVGASDVYAEEENYKKRASLKKQMVDVDYSIPPPKIITFPQNMDQVGSITVLNSTKNKGIAKPPTAEETKDDDSDESISMKIEVITHKGPQYYEIDHMKSKAVFDSHKATTSSQQDKDYNVNKDLNSLNRERDFNSVNRDTDFNSGNRERDFKSGNRERDFNSDNRERDFSSGNRERGFSSGNRERDFNSDNRERDVNSGNRERDVNSGNRERDSNNVNRDRDSSSFSRDRETNSANRERESNSANRERGSNSFGMDKEKEWSKNYGQTNQEKTWTSSGSKARTTEGAYKPGENVVSLPPPNSSSNPNNVNVNQQAGQPVVLIQFGVSPMQVVDTTALMETLSQPLQLQHSNSSNAPKGDPPYHLHENTK